MRTLIALLLIMAPITLWSLESVMINYNGSLAEVTPDTVLLKLKPSNNKYAPATRIESIFKTVLKKRDLGKSFRSSLVVATENHTIYQGQYSNLELTSFIEQASHHPDVESIQPNFVYHTQEIYGKDDGEVDRSYRWNMQAMNVGEAHQLIDQIGGWNPNITIAILDTGIYPHHPALETIYDPYSIYFVLFYYGAEVYTSDEEYDAPIMGMKFDPEIGDYATYIVTGGYHDWQGHGTHCAGMVAGSYVSNKQFNGVAPGYAIIPVKVMDDSGAGSTAVIVQGAMYALQHGADVFSLSLGGTVNDGYATMVYRDEIYARGIPIIAAAGNSYEQGNLNNYPAANDFSIAVAALGSDDHIAYYSQAHDWVDVAAPGGDGKRKNKASRQRQIFSTWTADPRATFPPFLTPAEPGEDRRYYAGLSGTSMATPQVAGLAALLRGLDYTLTPEEIRFIIAQTGNPVLGSYHNKQLQKMPGLRKANAYKAIDFLLSLYDQGGGAVDASWSEVHFEVDPHFPTGTLYINNAKLSAGSENYDLSLDGTDRLDVTKLPSDQEIFGLGGTYPPEGEKAILKLYFSGFGYIPDKSIYLNNLSSMDYIVHKNYNNPRFTISIRADESKKVFVVKILPY